MKAIARPVAATLLVLSPIPGVAAESFPGKQIRFVVPYPPGGPLGTIARLAGQKVS